MMISRAPAALSALRRSSLAVSAFLFFSCWESFPGDEFAVFSLFLLLSLARTGSCPECLVVRRFSKRRRSCTDFCIPGPFFFFLLGWCQSYFLLTVFLPT